MPYLNVDIAQTKRGREFLSRITQSTGTYSYFNSGVDLGIPFSDSLTQAKGTLTGMGAEEFLGNRSERSYDMHLHLLPNTRNSPIHIHPRGEVARVVEGSYFDSDPKGNPIHIYEKGAVIYYAVSSIHRPLTGDDGALLVYENVGGIMPLDNLSPSTIAEKLEKIKSPENAVEWVANYLYPGNVSRQQSLIERLFPTGQLE